jgi:ATP-dependent helicase/nuclease subunit A
VPYRLESSSLVYESAEVQQLLAILRAIDDPADTVSVLAALRSPAFGCGDDDLYRHHLEGGRWDRRARGAADTPVAQALEELASHHAGRWWQSVSALVGRVVADRRLMALALSHRRPRESWRRIRFLLDQARLFDETNGGDLRAFLRWVGHQAEDGARVTEAIVPESDDDAVRVVTVHGSKGLEYPVVVLMGLQKKDNHHKAPLIFSRAGPQFHFTKHLETAGYQVAAEHEAAMERFEQQRLLYVAATRAQELLLVSLHRDTKQTATLAAQLAEQCDRQPGLWSDGSALCAGLPRARPHLPGDTSEPDGPELRRAFTAGRGRLLERMVRPMTVGATGVRGLARDDAVDGPVEEPLERSALVHRRGRAGTAVGRAVHAVLQVIDLQTGAGLEALAHAQAVAEGVPGRERDVCRSVQAALHSDLVRQAVDSGRLWREMFVGVPVGQRVLEGFIDLLFESPEGLAIVDYKTDHLAQADAAAEVAGRYRLQGASYALAVEQALGRPVASCTFLFLAPSGAVAERLPDLSAAVTEARDLLSQPRHEEAHI